jgi:hypothetical protein
MSSLSATQERAVKTILDSPQRNFLLVGIAGSGKSFVIQDLAERLRLTPEEVLITSMTGLAADAVKGDTFHSVTGVGVFKITESSEDVWVRVSQNVPALLRLRMCKIFVIDEASLLGGTLFGVFEEILRRARNSVLPFGGVRVILVGDFLQLPPFIEKTESMREEQYRILQKELYCFQSPVWTEKFKPLAIYLRINLRAVDETYRKIIEELSEGFLPERAIAAFESRKQSINFKTFFSEPEGRIIIATVNTRVDGIHDEILKKMDSHLIFKSIDKFNDASAELSRRLESQFSAQEKVVVARKSRVMFLKKHKVLAGESV